MKTKIKNNLRNITLALLTSTIVYSITKSSLNHLLNQELIFSKNQVYSDEGCANAQQKQFGNETIFGESLGKELNAVLGISGNAWGIFKNMNYVPTNEDFNLKNLINDVRKFSNKPVFNIYQAHNINKDNLQQICTLYDEIFPEWNDVVKNKLISDLDINKQLSNKYRDSINELFYDNIKINLNNLQVGDIVGLTGIKSQYAVRAFMESYKEYMDVKNNSNLSNKYLINLLIHITPNTHVGYVDKDEYGDLCIKDYVDNQWQIRNLNHLSNFKEEYLPTWAITPSPILKLTFKENLKTAYFFKTNKSYKSKLLDEQEKKFDQDNNIIFAKVNIFNEDTLKNTLNDPILNANFFQENNSKKQEND